MVTALIVLGVIAIILVVGLLRPKTKKEAEQVVTDAKDLGKDVVTLVKDEVTSAPSQASGSASAVSGSK